MNIVSALLFTETDGKQQNKDAQFKGVSSLIRAATDQWGVTGYGTEFHFPKQMLPVLALIS